MLSTSAAITVLKPVSDVFAAVLKPVPYFVARTSAPMTPGKDVIWNFPEMAVDVPVSVEAVKPNELIRFRWEGVGGAKNLVEFTFAPLTEDGRKLANKLGINPEPATTVSVMESGWPETPE